MNSFEPSQESKASQERQLLAALRIDPVSTRQARQMLGATSSPAARVYGLKKLGHNIITTALVEVDLHGNEHRCALYRLIPVGSP